LAVGTLAILAALPARATAGTDWNDTVIAWKGYEEGLAEAKTAGKPICLIFYTEWCPHCQRYSGVFKDSEVIEMSKNFVMIKVERDANPSISSQYKPDGEYIPRTYFLTSEGVLRPEIHEQRDNYKYFYNEADPSGILGGMKAALGDAKKDDKATEKPDA